MSRKAPSPQLAALRKKRASLKAKIKRGESRLIALRSNVLYVQNDNANMRIELLVLNSQIEAASREDKTNV